MSAKIRKNLELKAREFNIVIEDVSITHLKFSEEFEKAIE